MKSARRLPPGSAFRYRLCLSPVVFGAAALFLVASLQAQDSRLDARQVYYKPQTASKADPNADSGGKTEDPNPKSTGKRTTGGKKTTKPGNTGATSHDHSIKVDKEAPPPLGLQYAILQEQESGGVVPVDPDKVFTTGDAIRLRIEVNSDAYVYLVTKDATGVWRPLFPEAGEDNHLKAYQPVLVPAPPANPISFAPPSGAETLLIQVSRTPIPTKTDAASTVPKAQVDGILRTAILQGRDLTRAKVQPVENPNPGDKNEWAVYTVNVSTNPGSQVIQQFELRHK